MNLPDLHNLNNDENLFYSWLAFVLFVSSLAGVLHRQELAALHGIKRIARLVSLLVISMTTGYLVYELALYSTEHARVSLAAAGIGAYLGTDTLDTVQRIVLSWIERGRK